MTDKEFSAKWSEMTKEERANEIGRRMLQEVDDEYGKDNWYMDCNGSIIKLKK